MASSWFWWKYKNATGNIEGTEDWAEFEDNWFAEGTFKYVYKGIYHGDPRRDGEKCVVKLYKKNWDVHMGEHPWKVDIRNSKEAKEMAELFNHKCRTTKPISVLVPEIAPIKSGSTYYFLNLLPYSSNVRGKKPEENVRSSEMFKQSSMSTVERYLEGKYTKFVSNTSYVNPTVKATTPVAFSHFTFHESRGKFLVTDLQGIRHNSGYEFTDPAIHRFDSRKINFYGPSDLGIYGIVKFFQNHICNDLCRNLLTIDLSKVPQDTKQKLQKIVDSIDTKSDSTYVFQLIKDSGTTPMTFDSLEEEILAHVKLVVP